MRCPRDPRCGGRDTTFYIHQCNVERAEVDIATSTIRDVRITSYQTVAENVGCWFESLGEALIEDDRLGRVNVARFNVWMPPTTDVHAGDRLKKGTEYFLVEEMRDYSEEGFHKVLMVRKMPFAQS